METEKPVIDEEEARQILKQYPMELGPDEHRSYAQIVTEMGLLPEVVPVIEPNAPDTVE